LRSANLWLLERVTEFSPYLVLAAFQQDATVVSAVKQLDNPRNRSFLAIRSANRNFQANIISVHRRMDLLMEVFAASRPCLRTFWAFQPPEVLPALKRVIKVTTLSPA